MTIFLLYLLIGIFAGLISGLLGLGGGVIVVPGLALAFWLAGFPHLILMHCAAGTALMIMVVTATSSIIGHYRYRQIVWPLVGRILMGMVCGVIVGAIFSSHLSTRWLQIILGVFLAVIALRMLLLFKPKPSRALPKWPLFTVVSFLIGLKSGLLGLGGGAIIIPFLLFCNVPMKQASGTSVACTLPIGLVGAISYILLGRSHVTGLSDMTGFIYWPAVFAVAITSVLFAQIGAYLNHRMPVDQLKRLFGLVLMVISINLLW